MYMYNVCIKHDTVCNCRQYCFDLVRSHQCSTAYTPLVPQGLYTQDYSEQLWFPLNEIHQLRVNQGKPHLQIKYIHVHVNGR